MKKAVCLMMVIYVLCLTACTEADESSDLQTNTEEAGFFLRYEGYDTGVEIFFEDCICEYDGEQTKVYSYYVDNSLFEQEGYMLYIQTADDTMTIFPVKDYLVDQDAATLYMIWGMNAFERIQGVRFQDSINSYKIQSVSSMEGLIGDAYGLTLQEDDNDFEDLQVEFRGIYKTDNKKVLHGNASALYQASGKRYSIEWEIETEKHSESVKAYLTDFDIHPLYVSFLQGELSVTNPYSALGIEYINDTLDFFDDRDDYDSEFENAQKKFSLVDVNNDGNEELILTVSDSPSRLMYILGVINDELICYDVFETHTTHMDFHLYDNGIVSWGQNYDGDETVLYTYTNTGTATELIHFVKKSTGSDNELYYEYYYLDGDESSKYNLRSNEEYEELITSYKGEEPGWFHCEAFVDIPNNY